MTENTQAPDTPPTSETPKAPPGWLGLGAFLMARLSVDRTLGIVSDLDSYNDLARRAMEYEIQIKQLAILAAMGNRDAFEKMAVQIYADLSKNHNELVFKLTAALDAKLAAVDKPGRQEEQPAQPTEGTSQCH